MPPKALGEGIVVVLDAGPGVRAGTSNTFYKQAKKCIINILQRKIFADKCRDEVGIVLFGTPGTDNPLATSDQYQHVSVMRRPKVVDWDLISEVEELRGSGSTSGDWLDALVVALDLLHDPDHTRYSGKKIVLFTDFSGAFSDDNSSTIISGLKNQGTELSIIGPDILDDTDDDPTENGDGHDQAGPSNSVNGATGGKRAPQNWNGKPKTAIQLAGEALVARIVTEVEGLICNFDEALPQLVCFEKRSAGSASWNTMLEIGRDFVIPITGKIKVKRATMPTWKREHAQDESAVIISEVSYHRHDDQNTEVQKEEVIPGYRYGTTLVPFSDADNQMKYQSNSPRSLSLLGFTKSKNVSHAKRAGDQVLVITAREGDEAAAVALSAFIQAIAEMDMVGITRRIYNKNSNPVMGAIFPDITKDYECLIWVPLPFQEDVRLFTFPSLQNAIQKLTDAEKAAMDKLISGMDLSCPDGEDEDEEELRPMGVLNPHLQHYFNVLTHRALHPQEPLPEPAPHVLSILDVPESVREGQASVAPTLASLFSTKRVLPKTKRTDENVFASGDVSKKKARVDRDESLTEGDLTRPLVTQVTSATPVQDFIALLGGEAPNYNLICTQMGNVIIQLAENLQGSSAASSAAVLSKIVDCLVSYRKEARGIDPTPYNKFITSLKETVMSLSLNNLWDKVKEGNLGLINNEESGHSNANPEEAAAFLELSQDAQPAAPEPQPQGDDMEDLLDDL